VPLLGGILTGHPRAYRYLQQSIDDFPSPSEFVTLLEGLRCDVRGEANDTEINNSVVGYFKVDELVNLNFGSVQLYTMTALLRTIE
jgi:ubiquinone/menaquinone biosynthesis C-methylase UbiE